ncbi:9679_t:CDS:10 [Diversispora eburnea]|uniref:9679_t:CDS:1 n=1 Tax=Diversispora eburnea TaxID=1213867 RepID=A0A9N8Z6M6_9GLOM|nr:9679_t:CDS:10 [Diversispora eburnea]
MTFNNKSSFALVCRSFINDSFSSNNTTTPSHLSSQISSSSFPPSQCSCLLYHLIRIKKQGFWLPKRIDRGYVRPRPQHIIHSILLLADAYPNIISAEIGNILPRTFGASISVMYPLSIAYSTSSFEINPTPTQTTNNDSSLSRQTSSFSSIFSNRQSVLIDIFFFFLFISPFIIFITFSILTGYYADNGVWFKLIKVVVGGINLLRLRYNDDERNREVYLKMEQLKRGRNDLSLPLMAQLIIALIQLPVLTIYGLDYRIINIVQWIMIYNILITSPTQNFSKKKHALITNNQHHFSLQLDRNNSPTCFDNELEEEKHYPLEDSSFDERSKMHLMNEQHIMRINTDTEPIEQLNHSLSLYSNKRYSNDSDSESKHNKHHHNKSQSKSKLQMQQQNQKDKRASDIISISDQNDIQERKYNYYFDSEGYVRRNWEFEGNYSEVQKIEKKEEYIEEKIRKIESMNTFKRVQQLIYNTKIINTEDSQIISNLSSPLSPTSTILSPTFPKILSPITTDISFPESLNLSTPTPTPTLSTATISSFPNFSSSIPKQNKFSSFVNNLKSPKYFRRQSDSTILILYYDEPEYIYDFNSSEDNIDNIKNSIEETIENDDKRFSIMSDTPTLTNTSTNHNFGGGKKNLGHRHSVSIGSIIKRNGSNNFRLFSGGGFGKSFIKQSKSVTNETNETNIDEIIDITSSNTSTSKSDYLSRPRPSYHIHQRSLSSGDILINENMPNYHRRRSETMTASTSTMPIIFNSLTHPSQNSANNKNVDETRNDNRNDDKVEGVPSNLRKEWLLKKPTRAIIRPQRTESF